MKNSKLIQLLRTFSKSEMNEFGKFVSSSYFADGKIYLSLLNELKKYYPDFNSQKLTRVSIYSAIYPGKEFKDTVIFTITSGLYNLAKEFLANIEFRNMTEMKELLINQQFHKRGLTDIFHNSFDTFYSKIYNNPYDSSNINILLEADELAVQHTGLLGKYENLNEIFERNTHNFMISVIEKFSKLIHNIHFNQWAYNINKDKITAYGFVKLFKFEKIPAITNNLKTIKICGIYSNIITFCFQQDEETYFELKKEIIQNLNSFSNNEKYELFIILTDFCQDLIFKKTEYVSELLKLFKLMLEKKIYLDPRYEFMQMALFRNILATAIRNNELSWAEEYVKIYSLKLNPQIRENAFNYANAFIKFSGKKYEEALYYSNKVAFEDFFYKKDIKQLTLQIYFELNYYEEFLSFCDSFKHFLNDNRKIIANTRKRFLKLVNYSLIMMNIKNNRKSYPVEKLKKDINTDQNVVAKSWLLQKINEISDN
jgi:hypothetical protein